MVVVVSVERLINVSFPHHAKTIVTHSKAITTVCIFPIIVFAIDTAFVITIAPNIVKSNQSQSIFKHACVSISKPDESKIVVTSYFIWGTYIPIATVIISSVITIVKLARGKRSVIGDNQQTHGNKAVSHATKMLLGISLMFLVTNGVFSLYTIFGGMVYSPSYLLSYKNDLHLFARALYTINYTCNFWVYTATGPTFRRELRKLFVSHKWLQWLGKSSVGSEMPSNNTESSM